MVLHFVAVVHREVFLASPFLFSTRVALSDGSPFAPFPSFHAPKKFLFANAKGHKKVRSLSCGQAPDRVNRVCNDV